MDKDGDIWIDRHQPAVRLKEPTAVLGSPGLRSVGKLAIDSLIEQTKPQLIVDLYSTHLPSIYQTSPSYAADPASPGVGGAIVESGSLDLPKVQFFACSNPQIVLVKGYHANFDGQYNVAEKVVDLLAEIGVKRMIVIAGYGAKEKKVCCAATSVVLLEELKQKFDIGVGYKGPFMGFSGLVFGFAKLKSIEAICLFASTEPKEEDLEFPDKEASERVLAKLAQMLSIK